MSHSGPPLTPLAASPKHSFPPPSLSPLLVPNCVPSSAANKPRPPTCRAIVANASWALAGPLVAFCVGSVTQLPVQPSAYPTSTRPNSSTVMSLKSSRLRHGLLPPWFHMQPRCTGSEGVASEVVHVRPPS